MSFRSVHLSLVLLLLALGLVSCASYQPPDHEDLSFRTHEATEGGDPSTGLVGEGGLGLGCSTRPRVPICEYQCERLASKHPSFRRSSCQQMIELVRSGRTRGELGRNYECSAQTIRNWVHRADIDKGRRNDGLNTAEREELRRLRREVKQLRMERDIPTRQSRH